MKKPEFIPYVVNTNTSIIFQHAENPFYKPASEIDSKREKNQRRKTQYTKVKRNGDLDYKKTTSNQRVQQWLHQGYCVPCRNFNQALYHQALSKVKNAKKAFDLKTGQTIDTTNLHIERLNELIERISKESPEDLIWHEICSEDLSEKVMIFL